MLYRSHTYKTPIRFSYTGGCGGNANCNNANCATSQAFHKTDDYAAQRQCTSNDVCDTLSSNEFLVLTDYTILSVWYHYHLLLKGIPMYNSVFIDAVVIRDLDFGNKWMKHI